MASSTPSTSHNNLLSHQRSIYISIISILFLDTILNMLHFNDDELDNNINDSNTSWKILIYDKECQLILSPLLNVSELRKNNITLHLLIDKAREKVIDVPIIYFVTPNESNILKICKDLENNLYETIYINFSSSCNRVLLELLANTCVKYNTMLNIARIYDQYCHFISLQSNLFTFNITSSYYTLNQPGNQSKDMITMIDNIIESILNVFITLGVAPVIRAQKNGPSEYVANKLDDRFRSLLQQSATATKPIFSTVLYRPVLCLLDRSIDLAVCLHHTWTYQALMHDVLKMSNNRVKLPAPIGTLDIDPADNFFNSLAALPFPAVAESVDSSLKQYTVEMNKVSVKAEQYLDFIINLSIS